MPQMAPMNWTTMMITFIFTMFMFNSMIYFSFLKAPLKTKKNFKNKIKNWEW